MPLSRTVMQDRNDRALRELRFALTMAQGQFKLLLGHCNYQKLRTQITHRLAKHQPDQRFITLAVDPEQTSLLPALLDQDLSGKFGAKSGEKPGEETLNGDLSQAVTVLVTGLETHPHVATLLQDLNQRREVLREYCSFPVLLWIDDRLLGTVIRQMPDLESWATIYEFDIEPELLCQEINRFCNRVFERVMTPDPDRFLARYPLLRERDRLELRLGLLRLQRSGYKIPPHLRASLDFVVGRRAYQQGDRLTAAGYFQRSLDFLRQEPRSSQKIPRSADLKELGKQELGKQGVLWIHLGLCQLPLTTFADADRHIAATQALQSLRAGLTAFATAMRPDLNAAAIVFVSQTLEDLQAWADLKPVLQQAISLHKEHGTTIRLATDYLMLAKLGIQDHRWHQVLGWAGRVLQLLPQVPNQPPFLAVLTHQAHLFQALAHQRLNQVDRAQDSLEQTEQSLAAALNDSAHAVDPGRYLKFLEQAREIYFELRRYGEAFRLKLKYQSIAQQYGFRAFIGASQLQAQRDMVDLNPEPNRLPCDLEAVSREIWASGREQDLQNLVDRFTRPDRKLLIIHGQSGVGKSSLMQAGLVPLLQRTPIAGRVTLPVILGVYADWSKRLAQALNNSLLEMGYDPLSELGTGDVGEDSNLHLSENELLEIVSRLLAQRLTIVLIFDQFEEFFFVYSQPTQRFAFYQFLDQLLSLPYVKAAISVRDDCLHWLLECDRWLSMEATGGDILNQTGRYYIGNFSRQQAANLIRSLTHEQSNFTLEVDLIEQLVEDLAAELGEVRPIELQIIGAQLQHERITTLAQYQQHGSKNSLVQRFLQATVQDCGVENEAAALTVLFNLTDKNGTRPMRTQADLAQTSDLNVTRLELVLRILLDSGLILSLADLPSPRYQLVHDYLVPFIRSLQEQRHQAETEALRQENRQLSQDNELFQQLAIIQERQQRSDRRSRRILITGLIGSLLGALILAFTTYSARQARQDAEIAERVAALATVEARNAAAQAQWLAHNPLDAVLDALRAGSRLQNLQALMHPSPNDPDQTHADSMLSASEQRDQADFDRSLYNTLEAFNPVVYQITERNRLMGHRNSVLDVAFAPNGQFLVSGSWDKTVRVWSLHGKTIAELSDHTDAVTTVAVSPDSQQIASGSNDLQVKLWTAEGKWLRNLNGATAWITAVTFSPDGQQVAASTIEGQVLIWAATSGKLMTQFSAHNDWILDLSWSPNGQFLVTASRDRTARRWTPTGELLNEYVAHQDGVTAIDISADSQQIVTASADETAILWQVDGTRLMQFDGHRSWLRDVKFSPDGQWIATAGDDGKVYLWERNGTIARRLSAHHGAVWGLSFQPLTSGTKSVTTSAITSVTTSIKTTVNPTADPTVSSATNPATNPATTTATSSIAINSLPLLASASADNTVRLWQYQGQEIVMNTSEQGTVSAVAIHPDRAILATASNEPIVRLWHTDGRPLQALEGHQDHISTVAFDPTGDRLVSSSEDGTAKVWRVNPNGKTSNPPENSANLPANTQSQSPLNTQSHSQPNSLTNPQTPLITTLQHGSSVQAAAFSADGQTIATAGNDGLIRFWNASSGVRQQTLRGHQAPVRTVAFDPLNQLVVSGSVDKTVRLWTRQGKAIATLTGHSSSVNWLTFSPNGQYIASASADNSIRIWDRQGNLVDTWFGHTGPVNWVAFSPDGTKVASVSNDHTLRLWQMATAETTAETTAEMTAQAGVGKARGETLAVFEAHSDRALSVVFDPRHPATVYTTGEDRTLRRWSFDLDTLMAAGCHWVSDFLATNPEVTPEDVEVCKNLP